MTSRFETDSPRHSLRTTPIGGQPAYPQVSWLPLVSSWPPASCRLASCLLLPASCFNHVFRSRGCKYSSTVKLCRLPPAGNPGVSITLSHWRRCMPVMQRHEHDPALRVQLAKIRMRRGRVQIDRIGPQIRVCHAPSSAPPRSARLSPHPTDPAVPHRPGSTPPDRSPRGGLSIKQPDPTPKQFITVQRVRQHFRNRKHPGLRLKVQLRDA